MKWAVQGKENQRPDPGWATLMHFPVQHISPGLGIEKASLRSRISQGGREFAPGQGKAFHLDILTSGIHGFIV